MSAEPDKHGELDPADTRDIYSETVINHAMNPRNVGYMQDPDGFARVTGPCGDTMEIWIRVMDGVIVKATFYTDGCGTSIACGSMITEISKGKSISKAQKTTQYDVLDALGGLPQESKHCALLAANTLKSAIRDYLAMEREPWKRAYRKY